MYFCRFVLLQFVSTFALSSCLCLVATI